MAAESRRNLLTTRADTEEHGADDEAREENIPSTLDTTDAQSMFKFLVQMEASIRSSNRNILNNGRVENLMNVIPASLAVHWLLSKQRST